jgi:hypothetical protein
MLRGRSTRRNTNSFRAKSLIGPVRLSLRLSKTAGRIEVGIIAGQPMSKAGVLGVGVVVTRSQRQSNAGVRRVGNVAILSRTLSNAGVPQIGNVAVMSRILSNNRGLVGLEPSRRPILLPATKPAMVTAGTTAFRRSWAVNRSKTADRRNRARQTSDRLQNGPLDLTRASKQTRPVDVR